MYANTSAWQPPSALRTEPRTVRFDLRDRLKTCATISDNAMNSASPDNPNPTDAFFGGPSTFANHKAARQSPIHRQQKYRQVQNEPENQRVHQEQQLSLAELQSAQSPLTRELIGKQHGPTFVTFYLPMSI